MIDRYAVVGNPVAHSKSPQIHQAFARQTGQSLSYEALLAPLDGFITTVEQFRDKGGRGLNVTVPFKVEAHALAHRLSPRAAAAGAVNTLAFEPDGVFGDNTDGAGLVRDLIRNLAVTLKDARILLLGAGGAARGAILPLLVESPARLTIANRTVSRAEALVGQLGNRAGNTVFSASGFGELAGQAFDVVINATSASLSDQAPPLPADVFAKGALAYDMMYGYGDTSFMSAARAQGAEHVSDGLGMLVEQAAESFVLWRGVRPQTAPVLSTLRRQLEHG